MELALLYFYEESVLKQPLKNLKDVYGMFSGGVREDEDVIQVQEDDVVEKVPEDVFHLSPSFILTRWYVFLRSN